MQYSVDYVVVYIVVVVVTFIGFQTFRTQAFRTLGISNPDPNSDSTPNPNP